MEIEANSSENVFCLYLPLNLSGQAREEAGVGWIWGDKGVLGKCSHSGTQEQALFGPRFGAE